VSPDDPRDAWYYRFLRSAAPVEINIDRDTANPQRVNAFINKKLRDSHGRLLGVIGIGFEVDALSSLLRSMESNYRSEVLFTNREGRLVPFHLRRPPGVRRQPPHPRIRPVARGAAAERSQSGGHSHDPD
jgi:hypothetical protein